MNYGNMGIKRSVLIRLNDLRGLEALNRNKILQKIQKTKIQYFPLYFGAKSFVKLKAILDTVPDVEIKNRFFLVFCIDLLHNNHNEAE